MEKYYVFSYDGEIIGEVEADNITQAWEGARQHFNNVLDVRPIWKEIPFQWHLYTTGEYVTLIGKQWESENEAYVAVTQLTYPDMIKDLRSELEPYEYDGVIELGNIVVMVGDVDGYQEIKVFPSFDMAFNEVKSLMSSFSDFEVMLDSGYFDRNKYLYLPLSGA